MMIELLVEIEQDTWTIEPLIFYEVSGFLFDRK